jgi:hypothetical protein
VPLFNFNVIVLVCDKKEDAQLFEFYLLRISNMLSDIVPIAILSQALLLDHRLNVEQLYLLHKGGPYSEKLAAYE